jgi:hypothetical protein
MKVRKYSYDLTSSCLVVGVLFPEEEKIKRTHPTIGFSNFGNENMCFVERKEIQRSYSHHNEILIGEALRSALDVTNDI